MNHYQKRINELTQEIEDLSCTRAILKNKLKQQEKDI